MDPAATTAPPADALAADRLDREMLRIRLFEERVGKLVARGAIRGTTHLCIGQEAVPVGISAKLGPGDLVVSTHRGHGHLLAKGARADRLFAELLGRRLGYCEGKGGTQHTAVPELGHMGSNGITGGGLPIAAGLALAQRLRGTGNCVVAYLGDGAAATGNFHETLNLAALWQLPVVFVMENNLYAMSTPVERHSACERFGEWASRYRGMLASEADGNDPRAVAAAVGPLLARARAGEGPGFLECATYRQCGHSKSDPLAYRTREEEARWRARDPLAMVGIPEADAARIRAEVDGELAAAEAAALASEPAPASVLARDLAIPAAPRGAAPSEIAAGSETTLTEALRDTLASEMARDPAVVLLGEDIGTYGGAFGVTRGLLARFGAERVRETPISENGFVGLAAGAGMGGLRPVAELMFGDFVTCCMDALVNHAAKIRSMYAGSARVPLTLRVPVGRRHGYGATHSQSLEAWFLHVPGLCVVFPATVEDAVGLLRTAIRTDAPTLFFEHKLLYPAKGAMPAADHLVPFGRARIDRAGRDLSLLTYGHGVPLCREAAAALAARGVDAEIVDLRSLAPLDLEGCAASARKTGRVLFVQEANETAGVCDRVLAALTPLVWRDLRAAPRKLGSDAVPIPSAPELEDAMMPSARKIVRAALALAEER